MIEAGRIGAALSGQAQNGASNHSGADGSVRLGAKARSMGAVLGLALLAACATSPRYSPRPYPTYPTRPSPAQEAPRPSPAEPQTRRAELLPLSALEGWADDDHAAALSAFRAGCVASHQRELRPACDAARAMGNLDEASARRFFERQFRVAPLPGEGVLTGYFAPVYSARRERGGVFTAPVRPPPSPDIYVQAPDSTVATTQPAADLSPSPERAATMTASVVDPTQPAVIDISTLIDQTGTVRTDPVTDLLGRPDPVANAPPPPLDSTVGPPPPPLRIRLAQADRALISSAPASDAIAWMRPEDLFFMQIQGSGLLVFEDGRRLRAAYAGDNGKPFIGIARTMVRDGQLASTGVSGDAIRDWLARHAGPEADAVMAKNPRYVFFRLKTDDGREPAGAAGISLPPGRAIALDNSRHTYGELYWLDAEAPVLAGAARRYRRLVVALDTGGAIRGEIRADLYFGTGEAAGREAGHVRHILHMARLVPIDPETAEAGDETPVALGRR